MTGRSRSIFNFVVFDDAKSLRQALNFRDDFFLHQIEAHGEQCNAEQQVQRAECNRFLGIFLFALD